ncbi:unnamed protein product [Phytophthora fragariaefolia]|uniref:Unnamed protein product n=1 Tax=Phytophthora fragariaefolia TaxID=1490495 RepID=A0A9W6Y0C5_9STRA|nr:unnamed protein product [Phytophthora fragariaefolia]
MYVGSAVCTTRVYTGSARVWTYGLIVGYSWQTLPGTGFVDINFGDSVETVPYSAGTFHDLAVEAYALRPCSLRVTSEIMSGDVKKIHQKIYDKFNGIGQSPVRDVRDLVLGPHSAVADETAIVPIFDVASSELYQVSGKPILDQVFYKEGGRNPPPGVTLRDSIFTHTNESSSAIPATEMVLRDGLSDSEDDDELPNSTAAQAVDDSTEEPPRKRRRMCTTTNSPGPISSLQELKHHCAGDRELLADIDQLISLRRVEASADWNVMLPPLPRVATDDKSDFQPSQTQIGIHQALVNGKFNSISPQQFVEYVQIHWAMFGFFPHPAVLRALFSWDFGTRGLSIMHFTRKTESMKRIDVRPHDMSNFSCKNVLPSPSPAKKFTAVLIAMEIFANVGNLLYQKVLKGCFGVL